jgi:hypothetical protein
MGQRQPHLEGAGAVDFVGPQQPALAEGSQQDPCSSGVQQGLRVSDAFGSVSGATFDGVDDWTFGVMAISVAVGGRLPVHLTKTSSSIEGRKNS